MFKKFKNNTMSWDKFFVCKTSELLARHLFHLVLVLWNGIRPKLGTTKRLNQICAQYMQSVIASIMYEDNEWWMLIPNQIIDDDIL